MNETKIEWCTKSFNAVVGCTFNCVYCYAKKLNNRFKWVPNWNEPKFYPKRLKQLSMKKPQNIFMNSMSDIADWEENWINYVAYHIEKNPQHNYMFLTKRIKCLFDFEDIFVNLLVKQNVWIGMTATTDKELKTSLDTLKHIGLNSCHTFISIEPIHEKINNHNYSGVDWIIVGAETGKRKEKPVPTLDWVKHIEMDTLRQDIPLFYKDSMKVLNANRKLPREFPKELSINETKT